MCVLIIRVNTGVFYIMKNTMKYNINKKKIDENLLCILVS